MLDFDIDMINLRITFMFLWIFCTYGYDNLSRNKSATQSTTQPCINCPDGPFDAGLAVDNKKETCTSTELGRDQWWMVDLQETKSIYAIQFSFREYSENLRSRQQQRLSGYSIYVSNSPEIKSGELCFKHYGTYLPSLTAEHVCVSFGRYVQFVQENYSYTQLCNLIVLGCNRSGYYGEGCNFTCPKQCKNDQCFVTNGTCLGCADGWTGLNCNQACSNGKYGPECSLSCSGHCKNNSTCNPTDGICSNGCTDGWMGVFCNKSCSSGTFGPDCKYTCSGHCLNDLICNRETGRCENGCKPGYKGELCNNVCSIGYFGQNCSKTCSHFCLANNCHNINGYCKYGCISGYHGSTCDQICIKGSYGQNCSMKCENCVNQSCHHTTGKCDRCRPGWRGTTCSLVCTAEKYGTDCMHSCSQHCNNKESCNHVTGLCESGCVDGYYGTQCSSICTNGHFGENCSQVCSENCSDICNHVDGTCICKPGITDSPECKQVPVARVTRQTFESAGDSLTVGLCVGATILIIFLVSLILFLRYRKSSQKEKVLFESKETTLLQNMNVKQSSRKLNSKSSKQNNTAIAVESTSNLVDYGQDKDPRGGLTRAKKIISIKNLFSIIEKMTLSESSGFKNEYMEIKKGELFPCLEAKKPENVPKNRYKTTYAYDHSRVVLSTTSSNGSDYINANFIEAAQGQRSYIATQGPKPKTISDFWSMVWQEKLKVIVCLTNLKEGEKIKCSQYWPNNGDQIRSGEFFICTEKEIVYADYIIRTLRLWRKNIKTDMAVMMFHYTKWPDHGVPDPLSLVIFHRHVMRLSDMIRGKYTLVHCSAGIGRTGTYIAIDALYREGEKTGKVNVQKYVEIMRKDRMNMIQGSDQYEIVYLTLYESFRGKSKCMSTDSFLQKYQQQTCYSNSAENQTKSSIAAEFEELRILRKGYSKTNFESGYANIAANYTPSILPVEEYRCHLDYVKSRGTYYNAVLLKSFTKNDILISAQYPLPDYTEDFLRLVTDFDVRVAVFLSPLKDIPSSTLWFPFNKDKKALGPFTVKFAESSCSTNISTTNILLKREGSGDTRKLAVLECKTWKESLSFDRRALLDAIKETKIEKCLTGSRILILSNDGAKRCGPFCVVYNSLEQISLDNEIDIFTITRLLQIRRPEFISTYDEYQFCHDVLAEYLQNDTVYANC